MVIFHSYVKLPEEKWHVPMDLIRTFIFRYLVFSEKPFGLLGAVQDYSLEASVMGESRVNTCSCGCSNIFFGVSRPTSKHHPVFCDLLKLRYHLL